MKIKQKIVWVALAAISATTAQAQGLKDAYKDYFTIGVAVNKHNIAQPEQIALIKREFNSVTAENDMKPVSVHPKEGVWNWGAAGSSANFCRQNGIKLRGHCLVWHSQFSDWMFTDKKGKEVKKENGQAVSISDATFTKNGAKTNLVTTAKVYTLTSSEFADAGLSADDPQIAVTVFR